MRMVFRRAVCVAALLVAIAGAAPAALRPIAETDILAFNWASDPQMSPDGSRVVYVLVTVNEEKDRYETALWMVPADGSDEPRQFTSGPFDSGPRWSPDGKRIVFARTRDVAEKEERKPAQLYVIDARGGGEAVAVTSLERGASSPRWSPDGSAIAFTSTWIPDDTLKGDKKRKKSDVRVVTRAAYRTNSGGDTDFQRRDHLWVVDIPQGGLEDIAAPRQITSGPFEEDGAAWAPDGTRLYFLSTRVLEPYYQRPDADIYSVPASGGAIEVAASIDGPIEAFAVSPNGKQIAFVGFVNPTSPMSYNQPDLFVADLGAGTAPRLLTGDYDFDILDGIGADQHPPRAPASAGILWSRDGSSVLLRSAEQGRSNLVRVRVGNGKLEPFTQGDQEAVAYTASADGARVAILISSATNIGDIFVADAKKSRASQKQITRVNDALFSQLDIPAPEEFWYDAFDGKRLHGWILKPPGFDASKKYPLILHIHGGPHTAYGYAFTHEFLWMAAKGYVVVYTNPRGSSSYGREFGDGIQYAFPGPDYEDLMGGVDAVVKRGYIDEARMGVTGGSGGGILTNWIITKTNRFKAAVSLRSIADWSSFWYVCDFTLFQPYWFRGAPWETPEEFTSRSPIMFADKIETPLMLIDGDADLRTPAAAGGEQMFRALKYLKKPTVMVRFPGETHELSRSGKPGHRVERLRHILGWFDKYLMGTETTVYDVK